jgi:uncharacterized protein (DUF362 family)
MEKHVVAMGRYERSPDSLREVIRLCEGLGDLRAGRHVLLKPNLVAMDDRYPMALYGVFTTTRLVEDMLILLKEHGVEKITIAEGSVRGKDFGMETAAIYEMLGYPLLARRYGVRLVDLLKGPFEEIDFAGTPLEVSRPILEAEFLINMPTLKTHNQAVLSLGLKNLKGALSMKSRRFCHRTNEVLDHHLSSFVDGIRPGLTVLDGIYGLEKGPFYLGNAVRMNAIAASRDPLALDVAGAHLAGIDPASVPYIREYADRHGRTLELDGYALKGTPLAELRRPIKWDNTWREDDTGPRVWDKFGIHGVFLPKYDKTVCSGCSGLYGPILACIMLSFKGAPFDGIEVLTGKVMTPSGKAKKTLLLGNCMIKKNRKSPKVSQAILAKGCPPSVNELFSALKACDIYPGEESYRMFRDSLVEKYKGKPEFDETLYYLH